MKVFIFILVLIVVAIFLPLYNGRVICGVNLDGGCWHQKINLIEYLKQR